MVFFGLTNEFTKSIWPKLKAYGQNIAFQKNQAKKSTNASFLEFGKSLRELLQALLKPKEIHKFPKELLAFLIKNVGPSFRISNVYIKYLKSFTKMSSKEVEFINNPTHLKIIDAVNHFRPITDPNIGIDDVFYSLFCEFHYSYINEKHHCRFKVGEIKETIVLIPGVFNELFGRPAFERAAQFLAKKYGVKYITPKVNGLKSTKYNSKEIYKQTSAYVEKNPNEKLWVIGFSKGGLDSLEFLINNKKFANKHISGLSTIASPLEGTQHTTHKMLSLMHKISQTKLYQYVDKGRDLLAIEFQRSISQKHQQDWMKKNYKKLPNIFYTSIGLYSHFSESHVWMMITKILFRSSNPNDGIVDADRTKFPDYIPSYHFGSINAHHLVGSWSSSFNQEALLLAHIKTLKYLKLLSCDK